MKKDEILSLLRERKDYVSGQELCENYGVSRTAIWKIMNQLKQDGYEIESVQNKGYRLVAQYEDILSETEIKSRLSTKWAAATLEYKEETGSTNNDCKLLAESGAKEGLLVVANHQNQGKGRRGRSWESAPGTTIAMSLLLRPSYAPMVAPQVTLVMALAMADAIKEVTDLEVRIKWPNDVVVHGKKVVGILTEMSTEPDAINHVVIGTGVNVNNEEFPEELQQKATSLKLETGHTVNRASIVAASMKAFEKYYDIFARDLDFRSLKEIYNTYLVSLDSEVRVLDPQGEFSGISRGINEKGELLVEHANGEIEAIYAGEVSVRGIYGYV